MWAWLRLYAQALYAMQDIVLDKRSEDRLTPCRLIVRNLVVARVQSRQVLQQRHGAAKLARGRGEPQECQGGQAAQRAAPAAAGAGWVRTQMGRGEVGTGSSSWRAKSAAVSGSRLPTGH